MAVYTKPITSHPDLSFEAGLWQSGVRRVAGLDEAGRGALAGPVAVGALILPETFEIQQFLNGVRDSKQLTAAQREYWAAAIKETAIDWGVGFASAGEIDRMGITGAVTLAAQRALDSLSCQPGALLLDARLNTGVEIPATTLVKGDVRSLSIAGASILAKTARDAVMVTLNSDYPRYGFGQHKGYGTQRHREALAVFGPCDEHRRCFTLLPVEKSH